MTMNSKHIRISDEIQGELKEMLRDNPEIKSESALISKLIHEGYQRRYDEFENYVTKEEFAKKINAMSMEISEILLIVTSHAEFGFIEKLKDFDAKLIKLADEKVRERMKRNMERKKFQ
ncbi:hypothetical protein ACLRAD_11275 [Gallibacterium anatis]|uniref:hypothetical protein n=1 Tax=Gallibacterium anatis TaxID=750 RepID=UPI0039FD347F